MSSARTPAKPATPATVAADPEPPQWLAVDVGIEDGDWSTLGDVVAWVEQAAAAVSHARSKRTQRSPLEPAQLMAAVALSTDDHVRRLNLAYRGLDKPTNVLSFPSGRATQGHLGDIILAIETLSAEARALEIPAAHHLQHLTVHGLLHLLGFDHETDADAAIMEPLETLILASLNIPDPYAGTEPVTASTQ